MTSFEFNLDSQRYLFQTELESFSQDGLHEQYLEIILSDVLFFYRHQQAMKAEAFTDFDLYKSLAHEMLDQISLARLRGAAVLETLRDLVRAKSAASAQLSE